MGQQFHLIVFLSLSSLQHDLTWEYQLGLSLLSCLFAASATVVVLTVQSNVITFKRILSQQEMGHESGEDMEFSYTSGWKYKLVKQFQKTIWRCLIKLNIYTPHDLTILLSGIQITDNVHRCTYRIFIAAFFGSSPILEITQESISKRIQKYTEINIQELEYSTKVKKNEPWVDIIYG